MRLVHPETRARVETAARELGYRADVVARSLRRGRTATLGVVVADLGNPVLARVLRGIASALEPQGFVALISETQDDAGRVETVLETLLARRVDGLIFGAARIGDLPVVRKVAAHGLPVVLAVRGAAGGGLPSVATDDAEGGRLAGAHLTGLGHELVGELLGPSDVQSFLDRSAGFAAAVAAAGARIVASDVRAVHPTVPEGQRLMEALLARGGARPTAVFAHNDSLAIGALAALRAAGLRCPADISLLGYNDAPLVDQLAPPLSTIRFPAAEIGRLAAEMTVAMIEHPSATFESATFPPELVVRESTAPPPR
jgi:LacI family transcriptional regulator